MNALPATTSDTNAVTLHRTATDVAGAIRDFALKRCVTIQGRRYPPVEVWQAVANGFGCVASAGQVEPIEGGIRAIGEIRRMSDGHVIATAEGFVGDDESMWAKRPLFARRAMAQTRAISRACRSAFAFVVPMIDAGIATTPAEEMEAAVVDVETSKPAQSAGVNERILFAQLHDARTAHSAPGAKKEWTAYFLDLGGDNPSPATFDTKLGEAAMGLIGWRVRVVIRPGRKADSWEFTSIEADRSDEATPNS